MSFLKLRCLHLTRAVSKFQVILSTNGRVRAILVTSMSHTCRFEKFGLNGKRAGEYFRAITLEAELFESVSMVHT